MQILQLHTPVPMLTPKGKGMAHFVLDYGLEHDLIWTVFLRDPPHAGEIWSFGNSDVRIESNVTIGRKTTSSLFKTKT